MSHIAFFSYARERLDRSLTDFFEDLCEWIALSTEWGSEDPRISFQDKNNLRIMENWRSHIAEALQTTSVLVCITETAYLSKEFCGKEYYLFDQRRRQGLAPDEDPPPVILPIIWAPVYGGLPAFMDAMQYVPKGIGPDYLQYGLKKLKILKPKMYKACVIAFADAIVNTWRKYSIAKLPEVQDFSQIPNMFADTDWQEAADKNGWIPGPEVANFVFAAGSSADFPDPVGRYGRNGSEWRPYLPPHPETILQHARKAAKSFKFRELSVDDRLSNELREARDRKNLTVFLADPKALDCQSLHQISTLDTYWWDGTGLILPMSERQLFENSPELQKQFGKTFPVVSQTKSKNIKSDVTSSRDLELAIETILADLREAVTKTETEKKPEIDHPPAGVTPLAGVSH